MQYNDAAFVYVELNYCCRRRWLSNSG